MSPDPEKKMENFFLESHLSIIDGESAIQRPMNLNDLVDVKPMKLREYLKEW